MRSVGRRQEAGLFHQILMPLLFIADPFGVVIAGHEGGVEGTALHELLPVGRGAHGIIGPRLTTRLGGKIRTVAFTQFASIVFLLMVGFWPSVWVAGIALLLRAALMNMSAPLYNAFCMEQTPEHQQGFVSSVLNIAWQVGWGVGPYISGLVQEQFGFSPLFITTSILYVSAILLMWVFFQRSEERVIAVAA